nr:MAG TPA: hypothetical protein [Caudoviricetes sp.]
MGNPRSPVTPPQEPPAVSVGGGLLCARRSWRLRRSRMVGRLRKAAQQPSPPREQRLRILLQAEHKQPQPVRLLLCNRPLLEQLLPVRLQNVHTLRQVPDRRLQRVHTAVGGPLRTGEHPRHPACNRQPDCPPRLNRDGGHINLTHNDSYQIRVHDRRSRVSPGRS